MNSITLVAVMLVMAFCARTKAQTWQELSSHVFTNAAIVWEIPSNRLPEKLWVYRRILPHVFPPAVISNAVVLAALQSRGFPQPSTNDFYILEEVPPDWPSTIVPLLAIQPRDANLSFGIVHFSPVSEKEIPDEDKLVRRAREYAFQLGLDPANLTKHSLYAHLWDTHKGAN